MPNIVVDAVLRDGEMKGIEQDGNYLLVTRLGDEYFAISDICSHARVQLSKGWLEGEAIVCPLHRAQFDVRDGRCLTGPRKMDLETYSVTREDDRIIIAVSD